MSQVKQDYVAKGLVQIVLIDVVIMHPQLDFFSHGLLHTIKNKDTVEKLIAVIFENQQKWATSKDPKNEIANYARLLGASSEEIEEAMNSKELYSWLKQTNEDLKKIKLEGTPTLIITKRGDDVTNYKDRFVGVVDYSTIKNSIDKVLKK